MHYTLVFLQAKVTYFVWNNQGNTLNFALVKI